MKHTFLAVLVVTVPSHVFAYCSEPSQSIDFPDSPGSYTRPSVPYCLSSYSYSGEHTCNDWEIDSYQREVREYISQLQTFIEEAAEAASKAADFAREAEEYARCEADEVASQHK